MELGNFVAFVPIVAVVLVPLAREYTDFRRSWGLTRTGAFLTTFLVVPAFGLALAVALPLAATPAAHWGAIVVVTLVAYSVGTRVALAAAQAGATTERH
jgi:hypothetical protein